MKLRVLFCLCFALLCISLTGLAAAAHTPRRVVSTNYSKISSDPEVQNVAADGPSAGQNNGANALLQEAQTHPEIGRIAEQTAKKVAQVELHRILTTPLVGCLGAPRLCAELDAVLHAKLVELISSSQFIERDKAMERLAVHGFVGVDAYAGALDDVAGDVGAEAVIGEDFEGGRGDCHIRTTVVDAKHLYALAEFSTRIPCSADLTQTALSLIKDPANGVSMIVRKPQSPDAPRSSTPIRFPTCLKCPDPHYSEFARRRRVEGRVRMMITVTEEGTVENAKGLGAVEESLQRISLETVRNWKLSPAIGPDGKPFRCRVQVQVMFRLVPR